MSLIKPTETFGYRDPPDNPPREQFLFLLEFFVHRVTGDRLAKLNSMFFVPTTITFKFLDFDDDDIAITPIDASFEPRSGIGNDDVEYINAGRSVMFAMSENSVMKKSTKFVVRIIVEKKMPENIRPNIGIGKGEIDMTDRFAALRKEMLQCWHTNYPPAKIFDGSVDIYHDDGKIGNVDVYARISGFGQSIVTEIETPKVEKKKSSTYVFKSCEKNDERLIYECSIVEPTVTDLSKRFNDNFVDERCPDVRQNEIWTCSPCELEGAGQKFLGSSEKKCGDEKMLNDHGVRNENVALESILGGKPLVAPWKPSIGSMGVTKSLEESRKIVETKNFGLPIQSSRGPVEPCGKAVVLKISGLLDVENPEGTRKQPTVTVGGGQSENEKVNDDPEHDVFILRIGKKGLVGKGEKSDIQVEMRTPKGPERRPPIRYETREIQTDVDDSVKGSGKSVKGAKKKKKKK